MKQQLVKKLTTVFFIVLFALFYISNPEVIEILKQVDIRLILVVVLLQFAVLVVNDLVVKNVVEKLGTKINFRQGLFSAYISSFGNYFLPLTGGAALRALYLKKNHNFSYKDFISMLYGMYIISFLATSTIVLISMGLIFIENGTFSIGLFLIMFFLLIFTFSLVSKKIRIDDYLVKILIKTKTLKAIALKINNIISGWKKLVIDKRLIIKLLSFALTNIFLRSIMYFIIFKGLSYEITLSQSIIYNSIVSISLYLTITPGSLGIREAMLLLLGGTILTDNNAILAVSLIDRATMIVLLTVMFVWFHFIVKERIE